MAIESRPYADGIGGVKKVVAAAALVLALSGCAPVLGVYAVMAQPWQGYAWRGMGVADLVVEVAEKAPTSPAEESGEAH
ncbi:hypothetical protein [Azospirillum sp. TSO5]|uniref:hypothetical protein n=1 Tax=Azospirillum sp. TSO5 TaxID=716760 RepID=UPI000D608171|nr:hypothetical protein [Azospirillum sp. TSO5]PWC92661.1 hypothetical protein TSO5_17230 [Azospirillum sp. TSO5]